MKGCMRRGAERDGVEWKEEIVERWMMFLREGWESELMNGLRRGSRFNSEQGKRFSVWAALKF